MQKSSATSELYDDSSAANFFAQPKFLAVDFRKWHLADASVSPNVRFAPEAVVTNLNRRFDEQSEGW